MSNAFPFLQELVGGGQVVVKAMAKAAGMEESDVWTGVYDMKEVEEGKEGKQKAKSSLKEGKNERKEEERIREEERREEEGREQPVKIDPGQGEREALEDGGTQTSEGSLDVKPESEAEEGTRRMKQTDTGGQQEAG